MALAIPLGADAVTAKWVEAALGASAGSLGSVSIEPLAEGGLAGRLYRVGLGWLDSLEGPSSVIVKLSPVGEQWRVDPALSSMIVREVRFYRELGGDPGVVLPQVFHADLDEPTVSAVIVMEDLSADQMYRPGAASLDVIEQVARCAARLHARHWGATGPGWLARFGSSDSGGWATVAMPDAVRTMADTDPDLVPFVRSWPAALATGALAPAPRTIVHGDLGLRNVAFRDGVPVVFDWQQVGLGDPAYDLLQLINEGAAGGDLSAVADVSIDSYLDEWTIVGYPDYDADELQLDAQRAVVLRAGTVLLRIGATPVRTKGHDEVLARWSRLLRWWGDRYGLPDLG